MYDRNVEFPTRYRLTKVAGTDDIYDLTSAPGDISNEGTLINKATLLADETAGFFGLGADATPNDALAAIRGPGAIVRKYPVASGQTVTAGQVVDVTSNVPPTVGQYVAGNIQVQNVPVGSFITRTENGVPQYYLVVHHGLPSEMYDASCNGTWVLRLNIYENAAWDSENSNVLPGADIFTTMAGMLSLFDAETQAAIKTVKIPYCVGGGQSTIKSGADGLECQIFPLGGYEVGLTTENADQYLPIDGSVLSYFTGTSAVDPKRISYLEDSASVWNLRSQATNNSSSVWYIMNSGYRSTAYTNSQRGIRPAFILNPTLEVDGYYEGVSEAVSRSGTPSQAIALQSGNAGDTIPVIFQGVAQLSSVTQGQQITSAGVQGYGALDGWLSVFPCWGPNAKVVTGTYQGTGVSPSQSSPLQIVLPIKPKLVVIQGFSTTGVFICTDSYIKTAAYGTGSSYQIFYNYARASGNTFELYQESTNQFNMNTQYAYVAIGY